MNSRVFVCVCALFVLLALPATVTAQAAIPVAGVITDPSGAPIAGAAVILREVQSGRELSVETDREGRYRLEVPRDSQHLVIVRHPGFSEAARTITAGAARGAIDLPIELAIGRYQAEVAVTAARDAREVVRTPLSVETISGEAAREMNTISVGEALANAANVTIVGGGPFGMRPRLRGLDSTRVLVLVDGERLNTARQATDRTGAEVGLIPIDALDRAEIVNGAGTLMYGSDALSGTINLLTVDVRPGDRRWLYGLSGLLSSNEDGARATASLGMIAPRFSFFAQAGAEQYDDYRAGRFDVEDTRPFYADGTLNQADTIDDAFGFALNAFPDPFNAPYVRTERNVPNSGAEGRFVNATSVVRLADGQNLRMRLLSRRMEDIGFPDFAAPYFFNATRLPYSNFDRGSVRYEAADLAPWLANVSLTGYMQQTRRLLENVLPVQFPVPTPQRFFPISVMRLEILSETEQRVTTPGLDLHATFTPFRGHLITAGATAYSDRSRDSRTTTTSMFMVGQVAAGPFGPSAVVLPSPAPLGPPTIAHPVRVPDASFRDIAVFAQDEWQVAPRVSLTAGLRADFYRVKTQPTDGYDVASVVAGAVPGVDPATLPNAAGDTISNRALTGDLGVVVNAGGRVTPFLRVGRSYRHANLEELLFAGPATIGSLAPNITLEPETGLNVDAGARMRAGRFSGSVVAFTNRYRNFIAQDLVVGTTVSGPLAQARNYAGVRISGVEVEGDAPFVSRVGVLTLTGSAAFTRGTITSGSDPLTGESLAGTPADNISPSKAVLSARFSDARNRWFVEYGVRAHSKVDRVALTLLDSPFLIAQDLLSLDGFAVQRAGAGLFLTQGPHRLRLTAAVENAADTFYREQFQFAPARGRTFTLGLTVGAF